jgi:hypothetical protein
MYIERNIIDGANFALTSAEDGFAVRKYFGEIFDFD